MSARLEHARREAVRRRLVRLVFGFYIALLGEGVLRKWVLPEASNVLVFLRDPLMIVILLTYMRLGVSPRSRPALGMALVGFFVLTLCAACQASTTDLPLFVLLAGVRNYFLFVPLCFVIADAFTVADYRAWLILNLWAAGPIAALVAAQYVSPPSAPINAVPGGGNDGVFLVVEDVVRPYGLFSFSLGHSAFAGWMAGLALAVAIGRRALRINGGLAAAGLAGVLLMGLLSGSRTYFLFAASAGICFVGIAVAVGPSRTKVMALLVTIAATAFGVLAMLAMPSVAGNLLERQTEAVANEGSTLDRIGEVVGGFLGEAAHVPIFGYGLGSGTNIAAFLANGRTDHILAEYELTRIVQELGPLFGGFYILLRWAFLLWLLGVTIRAAARGNLQPACFTGFLVPVFLAHDITLQNTMIGIGWFAAGILLCAERVGGDLLPERRANAPRRWQAGGARA